MQKWQTFPGLLLAGTAFRTYYLQLVTKLSLRITLNG